jgi:hypothetical protein
LRSVLLFRYSQDDQIKEDEVGGVCGRCGGKKECKKILIGKPDGKRLRGRPKPTWENDIKMDL